MEPCCEKMGELTERIGRMGVAAQLPLSAEPEPERDEQLPGLIFRSLDVETEHDPKLAAVNFPKFLLQCTEFINFCPFCGRDWRVPSVAEVLHVFTLSDAENKARRHKAEQSAA